MKFTRREMLKTAGATLLSLPALSSYASTHSKLAKEETLKGNIRHSVSYWCYGSIPLEEFSVECKKMGIESIELLNKDQWPIIQKAGLTCAVAYAGGMGIEKGFNDPKLHNELVASYAEGIPLAAAAGLKTVICFSGNRKGSTDEEGWNNCVPGLKRIAEIAEKNGVTLVMELLNSYGHKDYLCDHTAWGVECCKRVGSNSMKLLYDIYHMQIMEGNVIDTIKKNIDYIGHIHTGGVPGRNEVDNTQELYYPAIMKAVVATGYRGFVGQEYVPKEADKLASLKKCIHICDV